VLPKLEPRVRKFDDDDSSDIAGGFKENIAPHDLPSSGTLLQHKLVSPALFFWPALALIAHTPSKCVHRNRLPDSQVMRILSVGQNIRVRREFTIAFAALAAATCILGVARAYDDRPFIKALIEPVKFLLAPSSVNLGQDLADSVFRRHD
jgi:hypothetical protein